MTYKSNYEKLRRQSVGAVKDHLTENTTNYILNTYRMRLEMQFYKFIKKRFNHQIYEYGIK